MKVPAVLALADGTVFHGQSIGATGMATGEVVFNTGSNDEDWESDDIHAAGLVLRDLPLRVSSWRSRFMP